MGCGFEHLKFVDGEVFSEVRKVDGRTRAGEIVEAA